MPYSYNLTRIIYSISLFTLISTSCKKFITVSPPKTQLVDATVFTGDASATAAVTGIYSRMMGGTFVFASGGLFSLTFLTGYSSDELIHYQIGDLLEFNNNTLSATNGQLNSSLWATPYQYIYTANAVIEGLSHSSSISDIVKQQLLGEGKFIRAFCNFYLVNMFGDVPLITTTDYLSNATVSKTAKSEVYQQIISDIKDAQSLLNDNYSNGSNNNTTERVRPNKWSATALLARVYLYLGDWQNAEAQATQVISNSSKYNIVSNLNDVFLKNSPEAIWQLAPVIPGLNTSEGRFFILTGIPGSVAMSNQLANAFEMNDNRKASWVGSITVGTNTYYFPYKYKIRSGSSVTEYSMVLRLAEQYLIRAEARAHLNNIIGAKTDLNIIRNRAGLGNTTAITKEELLLAIEHERQVELFTEWGHRWFDLKRTNRADIILGPLKAPNWHSTDVLYPIPQIQIQNDPAMADAQNPGY